MAVWYCCSCGDGPKGDSINCSCFCGHYRCGSCDGEQQWKNPSYQHSNVTSSGLPPASPPGLHSANTGSTSPQHRPRPKPNLSALDTHNPRQLFPEYTPLQTSDGAYSPTSTTPTSPDGEHTFKSPVPFHTPGPVATSAPNDEGGSTTLWWCCECGDGPKDLRITPSCCYCNNHDFCGRCIVEIYKK